MKTNDFATRRRFFFGASAAALAAPAALAATGSSPSSDNHALLEARLAALEDANAIRDLQRAYLRSLGSSDDKAATIEIAADRRTATASVGCSVLVESPMDAPGCTLVDMARAQGEGMVRSTERRVLEQTFVRCEDGWKIDSSRIL
jgi:hypothetical protein